MPETLMKGYLASLDSLKAEVAGMSAEQQFDRLVELNVQLRLAKEKWQQLFNQSNPADDHSSELAVLLDQVHELEQQTNDLRICLEAAGRLDLRDPRFYQNLDQAVANRLNNDSKKAN